MGRKEKKFNKRLIGAVIGGTIIGLGGLSMTKKGKSWRERMLEKGKSWIAFMKEGYDEMRHSKKNK